MRFLRKNREFTSKIFIFGAVIAVIFSIISWIGRDIWLSATQWLIVAAVMSLFSLYLKK